MTGVATQIGNEDDDGNASGGKSIEYIDESQIANIEALLTEVNAKRDAFMVYYKIKSLSEIRAESYSAIIKSLEKKRKQS